MVLAPVAEPVGDAPPDSALLNRLEALLCELVTALTPCATAPGRHRGRPPILPALLLWAGLTVCVLRRATAQRELWRLLSATGLWHYPAVPVTDDAVYKRLAAEGSPAMAGLFADLTALLLATRAGPLPADDPAPFAAAILARDETTLDPVARRLPALRGLPPGDAALLPGKLAGVFDVRAQLWRHLAHVTAPRQNEKVVARQLVATCPDHSLFLCDLGYFAFAWFDDLTEGGHWWVSRLRDKTSYALIHVCYQAGDTLDALVWLGAHRADRAKHAVRLVQYRHGSTLRRYITNVTDPAQLPLAAIARLYARRWDIERAIDLVKTHLGLHLLWSSKPDVVLVQVWAVLVIAQLLQALRGTVAARAGVDLWDVSLPLLVRYLPQYAAHHADPLAAFIADGHRLGYIRPSRRTRIVAPTVAADDLRPPPPELVRVRTPRHAQRKCGPRAAKEI
jgi:hypothetical protein